MRIIDDKGRLFGKINIIDFLVLCFILSIFPMFYYGYKAAKTPKTPHQELPKYVTQGEYDKLKEEYDKLNSKINDYESIIKEKDNLQYKINKYLRVHKRAIKYFK